MDVEKGADYFCGSGSSKLPEPKATEPGVDKLVVMAPPTIEKDGDKLEPIINFNCPHCSKLCMVYKTLPK